MANIIKAKSHYLMRRDTLDNWESKNPVLMAGEVCLVTDTEDSSKMIKICTKDNTRWSELEYFSPTQETILSIKGELKNIQHDTPNGLYIIRGGTHLTASLRGDVTSDGLLLTPTIVSIGSVSDSDAYAYVYSYSLYEKRCLIYAHNIICFSIKSGLVPGTDGKPSHYEDTFKDISNEIVGGQGGGNGVVDQTYDPNSTNAQSGKAVAEALKNIDVSDKMDKFGTVKKSGNNGQTIQLDTLTYLNDSNGQTVAMIGMSTDELNLNKNLGMMNKKITNLGNPTTDTDAVNKNYVDTAIGSIDSALDSIIAIQNSILGGGA